jgi:hypothetical protein
MHDVGAQVRTASETHEDIREIIREASLQLPGSSLWWRLTAAALSAWTDEADRLEQQFLTDLTRRTDAAQRERLGRQWRAFMEARIRDQIPDAPSQSAICQLRRARPSPRVPPVAAATFDPIYCTCPDCDLMLDRVLPVLSAERRPPPPRASSGIPAALRLRRLLAWRGCGPANVLSPAGLARRPGATPGARPRRGPAACRPGPTGSRRACRG